MKKERLIVRSLGWNSKRRKRKENVSGIWELHMENSSSVDRPGGFFLMNMTFSTQNKVNLVRFFSV